VLKQLLLSKDIQQVLEGEYSWVFDGNLRFLSGEHPLGSFKTSLLSFPRTGNSMTRKLIEDILGVVTGSDMTVDKI